LPATAKAAEDEPTERPDKHQPDRRDRQWRERAADRGENRLAEDVAQPEMGGDEEGVAGGEAADECDRGDAGEGAGRNGHDPHAWRGTGDGHSSGAASSQAFGLAIDACR
jgi:hypothetical protein